MSENHPIRLYSRCNGWVLIKTVNHISATDHASSTVKQETRPRAKQLGKKHAKGQGSASAILTKFLIYEVTSRAYYLKKSWRIMISVFVYKLRYSKCLRLRFASGRNQSQASLEAQSKTTKDKDSYDPYVFKTCIHIFSYMLVTASCVLHVAF